MTASAVTGSFEFSLCSGLDKSLEFDNPSQYLPNLHPVDFFMNLKRVFAALGLALLAWSAFALPTLEAVQAAIGQGNYVQAETMMSEVVAAKPNSAKAHYLYAEILAHNKRFDQATAQAAQAKSIDPSLKFTQPEKFQAFEQLLEREQSAAQSARTAKATPAPERKVAAAVTPAPAPNSSLPSWIWALGGAAAALLAWRLWNRRQQAAATLRQQRLGSIATAKPMHRRKPLATARLRLLATAHLRPLATAHLRPLATARLRRLATTRRSKPRAAACWAPGWRWLAAWLRACSPQSCSKAMAMGPARVMPPHRVRAKG